MPWTPTTNEILNLDGVRKRYDTFRFDLIDQNFEVLGELSPDSSQPPTITNDTTRTINRSLDNLHLPADEINDINVVRDRVRVWAVLQNGEEFSLGVFLWGDASNPQRGWGLEHSGSLVDRTLQLNQAFTGSLGFEAGARTDLIFIFLLQSAGMSLSDIAESEDIETLNEPVSWSPGSTHMRAMTDVADQIGISPPWADRNGLIHLTSPPDPSDPNAQPSIPAYDANTRIIADSIVRSDDLTKAPNYFFVYDTGPKVSRTGSFRLDASAPHSEQNRGFRVSLVEGMQGLDSQSQANRAARTLARTKGLAFDWISWQSTLDPRHDNWELVSVEGDNYLETSWAIECRTGGPMSHMARRVYSGS